MRSEDLELNRLQIVGASGSGKSSLAKALLRQRKAHRRLIFDPEDEYEVSAKTVAHSPEELYDLVSEIKEDEEFHIRYVPEPTTDPEELAEEDYWDRFEAEAAGYLADLAFWLQNCVALVDEAHFSAGRFAHGHTVRLTKRGRKRGAFIWVVGQTPVDIKATIRRELTSVESWYGRLSEEADLKILRNRRGREFAERVANLEIMHLLRLKPLEQEPEEWEVSFNDGGTIYTARRIA